MASPSITIDLTPRGTMERLDWIAWFTDSAIRIPGTRRTIGADGVLSLIPGVGTLLGTGISLYVLGEAVRHGAPSKSQLQPANAPGSAANWTSCPMARSLRACKRARPTWR